LINGVECWRVEFWPGENTSVTAAKCAVIHFEKTSGEIRKVVDEHGGDNNIVTVVKAFGEVRFPVQRFACIPYELFPLIEHKETTTVFKTSLSITKTVDKDSITVEATRRDRDGTLTAIKQKWVEGEKWWREYVYSVDGKPKFAAKMAPPEKQPKSYQALLDYHNKITSFKPKFIPMSDPGYYMVDADLDNELLSLVADYPKRSDVIKVIEEDTGLKFTVAPNLQADDILHGGFNLPRSKSWLLMEMLASPSQVKNGKWTKTDYGYHLTGELVSPRDLLEPDDLARLEEEEEREHREAEAAPASIPIPGPLPRCSRVWLTVSSIAGILGITAFFLWRLRKSNTSVA